MTFLIFRWSPKSTWRWCWWWLNWFLRSCWWFLCGTSLSNQTAVYKSILLINHGNRKLQLMTYTFGLVLVDIDQTRSKYECQLIVQPDNFREITPLHKSVKLGKGKLFSFLHLHSFTYLSLVYTKRNLKGIWSRKSERTYMMYFDTINIMCILIFLKKVHIFQKMCFCSIFLC